MISDTRTPESVLKGKQHYYDAIRKRFGSETADAVFSDALKRISDYWKDHERLPEGQAIHVEDNIVPIASIYMALNKAVGDEAYSLIHEAKTTSSASDSEAMKNRIRRDGIDSFFQWWADHCRAVYGKDNGFISVHHEPEEDYVSLEILVCPYQKALLELGCPELIRSFCDSDNSFYGNLPGIRFIRTGTLGYGSAICDFRLQKTDSDKE